MISEKEKNNRAELFRLIQENPDLPIIPIVDGGVVVSDCNQSQSWFYVDG